MSEVAGRTINIVRNAFREYYFRTRNVEEPSRIEQREFGYSLFEQKGWIRHLSFSSHGELIATLLREAPADVYCSNAYYQNPTLPMHEKGWQGAFLIFDIDGKDLDLPCVPSHSFIVCATCKSTAAPLNRESKFACTSCGGSKSDVVSIPCIKCIEAAKKELKKLLGFLMKDIGIEQDSVGVYFSGNNGFHVHVIDEEFAALDSYARSDLAGYVAGLGLMPESVGVRKGSNDNLAYVKFPRGGISYGWRNKMAELFKIDGSSVLRLQNIVAQTGGYSAFKTVLEKNAHELGVRIDAQVTSDVHRIFRLPGTLNSKSGLAKIKCINIDSFDPFTDSCLLSDNMITVRLRCPVKFRLRGKTYNIAKESAELHAYAAVYLICKGLAETA